MRMLAMIRHIGQPGHIRRFRCQRHQVLPAYLMHIIVTQRPGNSRHLPAHGLEKTVDITGLSINIIAALMHRILRRDTHRTGADMTLHTGDTAAGNNRCSANRYAVRTQRKHFNRIDPVLDATHQNQIHVTGGVNFPEAVDRFLNSR